MNSFGNSAFQGPIRDTTRCSSALTSMDDKSREFLSHPLCRETDLRSRSIGAGGNGTQRTFSIVWNWDKIALGSAQALIPLPGESVQRSGTVAGSSLELTPLSSGAICSLWKEGLGCCSGCWGLQCSQRAREQTGNRPGARGACVGRAGWGGSSAAPGQPQQHSRLAGPPGMRMSFSSTEKGGNAMGSFWHVRYSEADF